MDSGAGVLLADLVRAIVTIRRLWKDPLLHFLSGGFLLFLVYQMLSGPAPGDRIIVDRPALLNYLQYRARTFNPGVFAAALDAMPPRDLSRLVDDYVNDEMLYRTAKSYGLEDGDEFIRQRLISKAEFLLMSEEAPPPPGDTELRRYYARNAARFVETPKLTFTHVFIESAKHGGAAERVARQLLVRLNEGSVRFDQASAYGDRWPFTTNFVARPPDLVSSQLGPETTARLMSLRPSDSVWKGPFRSSYGFHLVMLLKREPARQIPYEAARKAVREQFMDERANELRAAALKRLRSRYRVDVRIPRLAQASSR